MDVQTSNLGMMHNTENICFTCGSDPIACVCDSFPTTPFDQSYSFPQFVQGSSTSFSVADWSAPSTAFSQFSHPQFAGGPSEQWYIYFLRADLRNLLSIVSHAGPIHIQLKYTRARSSQLPKSCLILGF